MKIEDGELEPNQDSLGTREKSLQMPMGVGIETERCRQIEEENLLITDTWQVNREADRASYYSLLLSIPDLS